MSQQESKEIEPDDLNENPSAENPFKIIIN